MLVTLRNRIAVRLSQIGQGIQGSSKELDVLLVDHLAALGTINSAWQAIVSERIQGTMWGGGAYFLS